MPTCPHCGAELRENARFCPVCMTTLNQKRVVPTPKYPPARWLSGTAAVLVLVLAVWSAGQISMNAPPPVTDIVGTTTVSATASTTTTTANTTTTTTTITPTLTTLAEAFSTTTTTGRYTNFLPIYPSTTLPTYATTGRVPPFLTTVSTLSAPSTTTKTTTATTTTTTTKKPTTTTTTTRPYWQDATPAAFTEDGLPIEEVRWTYEPITSTSLWFSRCDSVDYPNLVEVATSQNATPSGVPLNRCIKVTGCSDITSNGIYRVPAMIDGKVVAAVDFGDTFADKKDALTVKRIYLPPDAIALYGGIENCTNLEGLYITGKDVWFKPDTLPDCGYYYWGGVQTYNLEIFTTYEFTPIYVASFSMGLDHVVYYAFQGNVYDAQNKTLTAVQCQTLYGGGGV